MIKTIVYTSNDTLDRNLYKSNTNSKFTTLLNPELLHYIPNVHEKFTSTKTDSDGGRDGEILTIALKSITFPRPPPNGGGGGGGGVVLGLRSNISSQYMICNANYDKLIALFMVQSQSQTEGEGGPDNPCCTVDIENPVFYPSSWPLLCNPTFELVEIQTNSTLTRIDPPPQPPLVYDKQHRRIQGTGLPIHPTLIEIIVKMDKSAAYFSHSRLMPPFNAVLVSNDSHSKAIYQDNSNTSFTIHLHERQDLQAAPLVTPQQQSHSQQSPPPQWSVVLKSIQLSSRLYNIPAQSKDYWFSYHRHALARRRPRPGGAGVGGGGGGDDSGVSNEVPGGRLPPGISRGRVKSKKQELRPGYYATPQSLLDQINRQMHQGARGGFPVGKFVLWTGEEEADDEQEQEEVNDDSDEGWDDDDDDDGAEQKKKKRSGGGGGGVARVKFLVDVGKLKEMEDEMMESKGSKGERRREWSVHRKKSRSRQQSQSRQQQNQGIQVIRPKNVSKSAARVDSEPSKRPTPDDNNDSPDGEAILAEDESESVGADDAESDGAGIRQTEAEGVGEDGGGGGVGVEDGVEEEEEVNVSDLKIKHYMKLSPKLAELLGFIKLTDLATTVAAQYSETVDGASAGGVDAPTLSPETLQGIVKMDLVNDGPHLVADYAMNLNLGRPRSLLICSNIVGKTNVGKRMVPLLRLLNLPGCDQTTTEDVMSFEFRQNCFASVDTMYFDAIHIYMTDLDGHPVLAEDNFPTILHLMFVNL